MKNYTLKIMIKIKSDSDLDAKRAASAYVKELPRMDDFSVTQASLYSIEQKKVIEESIH